MQSDKNFASTFSRSSAAKFIRRAALFQLTGEIRNSHREHSSLKAPALIVLLILFMIGFSSWLKLPAIGRSDAMSYHLLGPKGWIRVIRPVPDNCHTAIAETGKTLFATGMIFWIAVFRTFELQDFGTSGLFWLSSSQRLSPSEPASRRLKLGGATAHLWMASMQPYPPRTWLKTFILCRRQLESLLIA